MKKRIHVNQHNIRTNARADEMNLATPRLPVITVKTYKDNQYANSVTILGESKVVYSPDKPLSCGAKVWIETEAEVILEN